MIWGNRRTEWKLLGATAGAAALLGMSGCVVVIGNTTKVEDGYYTTRDSKARLGITTERVSPAMASQLGVDPDRSTLVTEVLSGWPAESAGLKQYDVITKVDGNDYVPPSAIRDAIRAKGAGETVTLTVVRQGQTIEIPVALKQ